jgi:hypothetical protein
VIYDGGFAEQGAEGRALQGRVWVTKSKPQQKLRKPYEKLPRPVEKR